MNRATQPTPLFPADQGQGSRPVTGREKRDPFKAAEFWKREALRLKRENKELALALQIEAANRLHDTRILFRAGAVFADVSRMALRKAGAPPFEESIRLAHGGTLGEFSAWWVATGKYVEGETD